jgi:hypothetical protein
MNVFRSGNVGVGGYIYNDRSGLIDRTGMQLSYAYHIECGSISYPSVFHSPDFR